MKRAFLLFIPFIFSCSEETASVKDCQYTNWLASGLEWSGPSTSPFPIHSLNWWTYTDSTFRDGQVESVSSHLYFIESAYQLGDFQAFQFNDFYPMMTVQNDTVYYAEWIREHEIPGCYKITSPFLFNTTDSVELDNGVHIYFSNDVVSTPAGDFSNNVIRSSQGGSIVTIFNEQVGIIKEIRQLINSDGSPLFRQVRYLKDYSLYE